MDSVRYLVFSGGGSKGMAFCGTMLVLHEMQRSGVFDASRLKGAIGCSIGSMFAMASVMGIPPKPVLESLFEEHLLDDMEPDMDLSSLYNTNALDTGDRIKTMVLRVITMAIDNCGEAGSSLFPPGTEAETLTFGDLRSLTKKELVCVASDVCDGTVAYIGPEGFADMPVWQGVVASMSIPVIFAPCRSDQRLLVDGALLCNIPLDYFPLDESLVFWLVGPGDNDPLGPATPDDVLGAGFPSYVRRLLDCSMRFRDRRLVEVLDPGHRLVRVSSGGLGATHFTLSRRQQLNAIIDGMVSTMRGVWAFRMAPGGTAAPLVGGDPRDPGGLENSGNSGNSGNP